MSSSPGTIGLMGNLIAYVFNPTPSPSPTMNESARAQAHYKQQQQQNQQQQHGRSISLDRATPPNFGLNQPNNNNFLNYTHNSSGTPPPAGGNRARTQSTQGGNNRVREDHFAFAEQQQQQQQDSSMYGNSGYNYSNSNNMNSKGSSSALSVDDDFVLIHNSSTERSDAAVRESRDRESRERDRINYSNPHSQPSNQPSQHASQVNSTSTSSFSGSGPNSTAFLANPAPVPSFQPQPLPVVQQPAAAAQAQNPRVHNTSQAEMMQQQQSYHLAEEVRTHEAAATQAFNASLAQKCEVYCAVASSITVLADQFVREVLLTSQQLSKHDQKHPSEKPQRPRAASMDMTDGGDDDEEEEEGIAGFLQQPQDSLHSHASHNSSMHRPAQRQATVDRYLSACSLYLHALSILANLLKSFNTNSNGHNIEGSDHLHPTLQKLKAVSVFVLPFLTRHFDLHLSLLLFAFVGCEFRL